MKNNSQLKVQYFASTEWVIQEIIHNYRYSMASFLEFCTLSPTSFFFCLIECFIFYNMYSIIISTNKIYGSPCSFKRKGTFRYQA